jgi:DNA-binding MarR family transcriptional regulator
MDVKPAIEAIRLNQFLPYQLSLVADRVGRRTSAIAKRHGLNQSHWRVLAALADRPGRTANEVVDITPLDKGIVSRAVKNLIDMDLITRKASKRDGRLGHLFLTAKGSRAYSKIADEVRGVEALMMSALTTAEKRVLMDALAKLSSALVDKPAGDVAVD